MVEIERNREVFIIQFVIVKMTDFIVADTLCASVLLVHTYLVVCSILLYAWTTLEGIHGKLDTNNLMTE